MHGKQQQQQQQQSQQPQPQQQHIHNHLLLSQYPISQDLCPSSVSNAPLQNVMNLDIVTQQQQQQQPGKKEQIIYFIYFPLIKVLRDCAICLLFGIVFIVAYVHYPTLR